ncbi:MAG: cobalamin B12-binding domain-containing protein [Candidatus Niyogibacteria bacterium]|nr:cobalamin B12-binding domain-containing protein [Candidatus Niyogibacteria bacterium]
MKKKIRIILAKGGWDGHDRGINIIKDSLINEGCEVFYFGLFHDLNDIVEITVQEGADFLGLSAHSGAHREYIKKIFERLKSHSALDIGLILGGIIPQKDKMFLKENYLVKKIFISGTPEADLNKIKTFFRENLGRAITAKDFSLKTKNDVGLALSAISNGSLEIETIGNLSKQPKKNILTIGITGPLGAGKSSLIDKMIAEFRMLNKKVGVITVDPSDPLASGALLGRDRTQMWRHLYDPEVHIYSMATRGFQGGIAEATPKAMKIMKAADYDVILVETIGIGQDQVAIKNIVKKVILVLTPDVGEDQVHKSGIMQIADYYVINKADISNPLTLEKAINNMLDQKQFDVRPLVFKTMANKIKDNNIKELAEKIIQS